jgi:hypothetical protein
MKPAVVLLLVAAALAVSTNARASGWCGQDDAACDSAMAYVECADGTVWVVDPALADADAFGAAMCAGGWTVLQPDAVEPAPPQPSPPLDLDPSMAPDPSLYVGEVTCPDGSVWAVARGDAFTCPSDP